MCIGDSLISCWFCFFLCLEGEEGCPPRSVAAGGMCGISLQPPARPGSGRPYLLITGRCIWAERGLAVEGWTFTGHPSWGKLPVRSSALAFGGLLCGQHRCHNTLWPQSRSSSGARPGLVQLVSTEPGPIEAINQCLCNESLCFYKINTLHSSSVTSEVYDSSLYSKEPKR